MRHSFSTTATLFVALAGLAAAQKCPDYGIRECTDPEILALETDNCTDYHIFIARGSDSASPGHQGDMVRLVCEGIDGSCNYENIEYPANSSWSGEGVWCPSAATGAKHGQSQMADYAKRCPESELILFGYSQGGSVALDILGGGGGKIYDCVQDDNAKMDRDSVPGSRLLAAAAFGAPRRTGNQTYSLGEGKDFNGTALRTPEQLDGLAPYRDILREYCNHGDPICAPDSKPMAVENHWSYFEKYQKDVADWVISLAKEEKGGQGGKNGTKTSASASSTSASSTPRPTTSATVPVDVENNAAETGSPDAAGSANAGLWCPLSALLFTIFSMAVLV